MIDILRAYQKKEVFFIKMHGLGNDFIFIKDEDVESIGDFKNFVIKISDRKIGIGCDQFIIYKVLDHSDITDSLKINMDVYNQDGSKANICGNAARCLGSIMYNLYSAKNILINSNNRIIKCEYSDMDSVSVNMGSASFKEEWMPESDAIWDFAKKYRLNPKELLCVDVCNPHIVIFSHHLSEDEEVLIGKELQHSDLFPHGVNVGFAKLNNRDSFYLKVWERGVGFTLACGSGACASFVAAHKLGFVSDEVDVIFSLGKLRLRLLNDKNLIQKDNKEQKYVSYDNYTDIIMTGPTDFIMDGKFYY